MLPARIDVACTAEELVSFDAALTTLENLLARIPALSLR
jgi:hypothetical protein